MSKAKKKRDNLLTLVLGLWIGVALGALLLFGLNGLGILDLNLDQLGQAISPSIAPAKDDPAPDFTLADVSGQAVQLSTLHGKVVVLNFWATWCGPCVREMPMFQDAQDRYTDRLVVLGVNSEEKSSLVAEFIQNLGIHYQILVDEFGAVSDLYQVLALPSTIFIDEQGIIRRQHTGVMSEDQFQVYLTQVGIAP